MALVIKDRVKETTTTTGTGTYTLGGAVTGFETFTANLSNADTTYYVCTDNTDFEVGLGTFTSSGTTLARTTILASSNSNNEVNWSSGTRTIFMTYPADKAVFEDADGHVSIPHDLFIAGGLIDLKNDGGAVSQIKFYCESSNAHAQTLIGAPHSESASNTLTLPSSGGDAKLVSATSTATLTNKTLTTPTINGATIGSANLATSSNGDINFAPNGTGKIVVRGNTNQGKIVLNCESNSHGQTIIAAPHSETANNVLTLPSTGGDARLVSTSSTATLTNKTIDSDNNTITNIVNADIKSSAAIANSKLANSSITVSDGSNTSAVALGGTLTFSGTNNEVEVAESSGTVTIGLPSAITANVTGALTGNADTATALATGRTIGMTGDVVWTSASFDGSGNVTGSATIQAGAVENSMLADDAVGADELAADAVVNASVASGAAIAFSKMENLTASRALVSDGNGDVSVATTTATEIGHVNGVTGAIQGQIDEKASKGFATAMAIAL